MLCEYWLCTCLYTNGSVDYHPLCEFSLLCYLLSSLHIVIKMNFISLPLLSRWNRWLQSSMMIYHSMTHGHGCSGTLCFVIRLDLTPELNAPSHWLSKTKSPCSWSSDQWSSTKVAWQPSWRGVKGFSFLVQIFYSADKTGVLVSRSTHQHERTLNTFECYVTLEIL